MALDLDALKEVLGENFPTVRDHVAGLQSAADLAKREAERLRSELEAGRSALDTMKTERNAAFDKLGITEVADLDNIKDAQGSAEQVAQLAAKLKRYERDLGEHQSRLSAANETISGLRRDKILGRHLGSHDWAEGNADLVRAYFDPRLVPEGDDWVFRAEDGSTSTLEDALTQFVSSHPGLLSSRGEPGGGTKKPAMGGHQKPFREMTITEKTDLYRRSPQQFEAIRLASEN